MINRNRVKWATSRYLYNYGTACGKSYSNEDDGIDGVYNPRFENGKQIKRAPRLDKCVIDIIIDGYINRRSTFYDPWYGIESLQYDFDANMHVIRVAIVKNKVNGVTTKWIKGNRNNSVWKKVK